MDAFQYLKSHVTDRAVNLLWWDRESWMRVSVHLDGEICLVNNEELELAIVDYFVM